MPGPIRSTSQSTRVRLNTIAYYGTTLGSTFLSGLTGGGGAVVTAEGIVINAGESVAIAEAYEADLSMGLVGILAAEFGNGGNEGDVEANDKSKDNSKNEKEEYEKEHRVPRDKETILKDTEQSKVLK